MTMARKRQIAAICPTCNGTRNACPACNGNHKARCHRCQRLIYRGEWASPQKIGPLADGSFARVFVCQDCAEDMGIALVAHIHIVPKPRRRAATG